MDKPNNVTLKLNREEQTVETKPLTVLCHNGQVNIQPVDEDVVEINPIETVKLADSLTPDDWFGIRNSVNFCKLWHCVFPDIAPPEKLQGEGMGYRHVIGLILLLVQVAAANKRPYVRFPESYLHPRAQLGLADLFVMFERR